MAKNLLNILIYHRVLPANDELNPGDVDIYTFTKQMKWVSKLFNVLSLEEAVQKISTNSLPQRALCITFDDGYRDNYTNALPILKAFGLTATFFVATGFLNGGIMWNDVVIESIRNTESNNLDLTKFDMNVYHFDKGKNSAIKEILQDLKYLPLEKRSSVVESLPIILDSKVPDNLMMNDGDVKEMYQSGMGVGGHTKSHPILSSLDIKNAENEIVEGKNYLENLLDARVDLFAYPNGKPYHDYGYDHITILKKYGFKAAVSTSWGVASPDSDLYQLPRFTPWDTLLPKFLARLVITRFSKQKNIVKSYA